jgi:hypothetical protein
MTEKSYKWYNVIGKFMYMMSNEFIVREVVHFEHCINKHSLDIYLAKKVIQNGFVKFQNYTISIVMALCFINVCLFLFLVSLVIYLFIF